MDGLEMYGCEWMEGWGREEKKKILISYHSIVTN